MVVARRGRGWGGALAVAAAEPVATASPPTNPAGRAAATPPHSCRSGPRTAGAPPELPPAALPPHPPCPSAAGAPAVLGVVAPPGAACAARAVPRGRAARVADPFAAVGRACFAVARPGGEGEGGRRSPVTLPRPPRRRRHPPPCRGPKAVAAVFRCHASAPCRCRRVPPRRRSPLVAPLRSRLNRARSRRRPPLPPRPPPLPPMTGGDRQVRTAARAALTSAPPKGWGPATSPALAGRAATRVVAPWPWRQSQAHQRHAVGHRAPRGVVGLPPRPQGGGGAGAGRSGGRRISARFRNAPGPRIGRSTRCDGGGCHASPARRRPPHSICRPPATAAATTTSFATSGRVAPAPTPRPRCYPPPDVGSALPPQKRR